MLLVLNSNLLAADRQRRRKRSSSDLGINYPGDLLSQVKPKRPAVLVPPLLKRNTIADFAITRAYTSTASFFSVPPEQGKHVNHQHAVVTCVRQVLKHDCDTYTAKHR